jgi:hypothetical protein
MTVNKGESDARRPIKPAPGPTSLARPRGRPRTLKVHRCEAKTLKGTACEAPPLQGKNRCVMHYGDNAKTLGSRGGHRRAVYKPDNLATFDAPKDARDLMRLLAQTIVDVRVGKMETKIASCISYLSTSFLNAFEIADLDERLKILEARRDEPKSN